MSAIEESSKNTAIDPLDDFVRYIEKEGFRSNFEKNYQKKGSKSRDDLKNDPGYLKHVIETYKEVFTANWKKEREESQNANGGQGTPNEKIQALTPILYITTEGKNSEQLRGIMIELVENIYHTYEVQNKSIANSFEGNLPSIKKPGAYFLLSPLVASEFVTRLTMLTTTTLAKGLLSSAKTTFKILYDNDFEVFKETKEKLDKFQNALTKKTFYFPSVFDSGNFLPADEPLTPKSLAKSAFGATKSILGLAIKSPFALAEIGTRTALSSIGIALTSVITVADKIADIGKKPDENSKNILKKALKKIGETQREILIPKLYYSREIPRAIADFSYSPINSSVNAVKALTGTILVTPELGIRSVGFLATTLLKPVAKTFDYLSGNKSIEILKDFEDKILAPKSYNPFFASNSPRKIKQPDPIGPLRTEKPISQIKETPLILQPPKEKRPEFSEEDFKKQKDAEKLLKSLGEFSFKEDDKKKIVKNLQEIVIKEFSIEELAEFRITEIEDSINAFKTSATHEKKEKFLKFLYTIFPQSEEKPLEEKIKTAKENALNALKTILPSDNDTKVDGVLQKKLLGDLINKNANVIADAQRKKIEQIYESAEFKDIHETNLDYLSEEIIKKRILLHDSEYFKKVEKIKKSEEEEREKFVKENEEKFIEQRKVLEFLLENPSLLKKDFARDFLNTEKQKDLNHPAPKNTGTINIEEGGANAFLGNEKEDENNPTTEIEARLRNYLDTSQSRIKDFQQADGYEDKKKKSELYDKYNSEINDNLAKLFDIELGIESEKKFLMSQTTPLAKLKGIEPDEFKQKLEETIEEKQEKNLNISGEINALRKQYDLLNLEKLNFDEQEGRRKKLEEYSTLISNLKQEQEKLRHDLSQKQELLDAINDFDKTLENMKSNFLIPDHTKETDPAIINRKALIEFIEHSAILPEKKNKLAEALKKEREKLEEERSDPLKDIGENIKFLKQNPDLVSEELKQEILTFRAKLPEEEKGSKNFLLSMMPKINRKTNSKEEFLEGLDAIEKYTKSQSSKRDERISTKDILQFKASFDEKIDTKFTQHLKSYIKLLESEDMAKFKIGDLKELNKQFKALKILFPSPKGEDVTHNNPNDYTKLYHIERLKALNALKTLITPYPSTEDKKKTIKDSIPIFKALEKIGSSIKKDLEKTKSSFKKDIIKEIEYWFKKRFSPAPNNKTLQNQEVTIENSLPKPNAPISVEAPPPPAQIAEVEPSSSAQIEAQNLTSTDILGGIVAISPSSTPEAQIADEATPTPAPQVEAPKLPKWVYGDNLANIAKMFTPENKIQSPSPSPREELEAKRLSPEPEIGPKP